MITSYVPKPNRWIPAVIFVPVVCLWGGCSLNDYLSNPKWTSPGGTAAEHLRLGRQALEHEGETRYNDFASYSEQTVPVAALEFEAALLIDPKSEEASLGLTECLEILGDRATNEGRAAQHRRGLILVKDVLRTTKDAGVRYNALKQVASFHQKLGDDLHALDDYERLLKMSPDANGRTWFEKLAAETNERLERMGEAHRLYSKLERESGHKGQYMEDVVRTQKLLNAWPKR